MLPLTTRKHRGKLWAAIGAGLSVTLLVVVLLSLWIANSRPTHAAVDSGSKTTNSGSSSRTASPKPAVPPKSFGWYEFKASVNDGKTVLGLSEELSTSPKETLHDGSPSPIAKHPEWIGDYWLAFWTFEERDFKVMVVDDGDLSKATPLISRKPTRGVTHSQCYTCLDRPVRMYAGYIHISISPEEAKTNPPPELLRFKRDNN